LMIFTATLPEWSLYVTRRHHPGTT
jgi:hypothetical protein